MTFELVHMAAMGLLVSVVAPLLLLTTRHRLSWRWVSWPAPLVLPGFVLVHSAIMLRMAPHDPPPALHLLLDGTLLAAATVFWLPVLGGKHRLEPLARAGYLFLAAPALDLAGVVVVARGDSVGGLAMIVGMLPVGVAALVIAWRALRDEEANADEADGTDVLTRDGVPAG